MLPPALTLSAQRLLESDSHCKVFPTAELHPKVKSPHAAFGLWPSVSCTVLSPSHSVIHHYFLKCCHIPQKCTCLIHTHGFSSQISCYQKWLPWQCGQGNLGVQWLDLFIVHSANNICFSQWLPTWLLSAVYWLEGKNIVSVLQCTKLSYVKMFIGWISLVFQMLLSHDMVVRLGNWDSEDLEFIAFSLYSFI